MFVRRCILKGMTLGNPLLIVDLPKTLFSFAIMHVLVATTKSVPKFDFATGVKGPGRPRRQRRQGTPSLKKKVYL